MKKWGLLAGLLAVFLVPQAGVKIAGAQTVDGPPWEKSCADPEDQESCRITQNLFLSQKDAEGKQQTVGKILGLTVIYATDQDTEKRTPYLSIQMPLGLDLRPGAVVRVDEGEERPLPFLQCTTAGCDASLRLDPPILAALKAGQKFLVGFRPWGQTQTTVVEASLTGFTKAFSSLK